MLFRHSGFGCVPAPADKQKTRQFKPSYARPGHPQREHTAVHPRGERPTCSQQPSVWIPARRHIGLPFVSTPPPPIKLLPPPSQPPPPPPKPPPKPLARGGGGRSCEPRPCFASVSLASSKSAGRRGPASPLSSCARLATMSSFPFEKSRGRPAGKVGFRKRRRPHFPNVEHKCRR